MYCGAASLETPSIDPEETRALIPARPLRAAQAYIGLLPGQDGPAAARTLAEVLGCDMPRAHQWLRRPDLAILGLAGDAVAQETAGRLERAGVRLVAFTQREIDQLPPAIVARDVEVLADLPPPGADPYRGAGVAELRVTNLSGGATRLRLDRVRFACQGSVEAEQVGRPEFLLSPRGQDVEGEQPISKHPEIDVRRVLDLYGDLPAPVRVIERLTNVFGLGTRRFEQAAGFGKLLTWLEQNAPRLPIHRELDRMPAADWDESSTITWLVHSSAGARAPA